MHLIAMHHLASFLSCLAVSQDLSLLRWHALKPSTASGMVSTDTCASVTSRPAMSCPLIHDRARLFLGVNF